MDDLKVINVGYIIGLLIIAACFFVIIGSSDQEPPAYTEEVCGYVGEYHVCIVTKEIEDV